MERQLKKIWPGWNINELIGEGAFGRVYHITREEYGNVYHAALKVIQIPQNQSEYKTALSEGMTEEETKEYFETIVKDIVSEVTLMSRLKGITNIVSYEDHAVVPHDNEVGWDILIRMELLAPLYDHIRQHPLTKKDVIKMGIDICKALETCQRYNIIHRDIKPENIFVSELGFYKLGDFGIARQLEQTLSNLSQKGTYSYMAPEMYKGEPYNSTVDIYSLGIVLYRFLNDNRTPFMPPAGTPIRYTDKQQANTLRISGKELPPPVNAEGRLGEIILKACAYDPKERYQDAGDLRKDLESVLNDSQEEEVSYPESDELENRENVYIDPPEKEPEKKAPEPEKTTGIFSNMPVGATEEEGEKEEIDPEADQQDEKEVQSEEVHQREMTVSAFPDESDSDEAGKTESHERIEENKKKKNKIPLIAAILLLCIGLGAGGYFFYQKSLERDMPDFTGMTYEEAKSLGSEDANYITVEQAGSEYSDTVEKGDIISQNVKAGTVVKRGAEVEVLISKGALVEVPDVTGISQKKAEGKLKKAGLTSSIKKEKWSDEVEKGNVIKQSVEKGTKLEEGSEVALVISKGVEQVKVPDVTGKSETDAKKKLKDAKLKVETSHSYSESVEANNVISQSIDAKKTVDKNTKVAIVISDGPEPAPEPTYSDSNKSRTSNKNSSKSSKKKSSKKRKKNNGIDKWDLIN